MPTATNIKSPSETGLLVCSAGLNRRSRRFQRRNLRGRGASSMLSTSLSKTVRLLAIFSMSAPSSSIISCSIQLESGILRKKMALLHHQALSVHEQQLVLPQVVPFLDAHLRKKLIERLAL